MIEGKAEGTHAGMHLLLSGIYNEEEEHHYLNRERSRIVVCMYVPG